MNKKKIVIGARGSKLAIKYAELAIEKIKKFYNGNIELKKIVTKGDKILNRRTSDIGGKGEFVKNIEKEFISMASMNCWIYEQDIGKICSFLISDDALRISGQVIGVDGNAIRLD